MKNLLVAVALVAVMGASHSAGAAEDGMKLNAHTIDIPGQPQMCLNGGSSKFGFNLVGNQLIAGNQKTYKGLFTTTVASDGAVNVEYTSPGNLQWLITGNIRNKNIQLVHKSSGCRFGFEFTN